MNTAVALLAHEPRIDDPALSAALCAKCFYIGALGSKKTHAKRLERLRAAGFSEAGLARIHSPISLAIGAPNPAEIGIAIAAEIIAALRKRIMERRSRRRKCGRLQQLSPLPAGLSLGFYTLA